MVEAGLASHDDGGQAQGGGRRGPGLAASQVAIEGQVAQCRRRQRADRQQQWQAANFQVLVRRLCPAVRLSPSQADQKWMKKARRKKG